MANALFDSKTQKYNRAAIMQLAWAYYYEVPAWDRAQGGIFTARQIKTFNRERFAVSLRQAWATAREAARSNADKIAILRNEREALKYKSLQVSIVPRLDAIDREIRALEAA